MHKDFQDILVSPDGKPFAYEGDTESDRWTAGRLTSGADDKTIEVEAGIPLFAGAENDPWGGDEKVEAYFKRIGRTPSELIQTNYDNVMNNPLHLKQFDQEIDKVAGQGGCILEVSCGHGGGFAPMALRKYPDACLLMTDQGRWVLREWRRFADEHKWGNVSFAQMNPASLPLRDDSVSAVMTFGGYSNTAANDPALQEAHRVLKPGGWLLMLDARPDPSVFRKFPRDTREKIKSNYPAFGVSYQKLLKSVGFEAGEYVETGRRQLGTKGLVAEAARKCRVHVEIIICKVTAQKNF